MGGEAGGRVAGTAKLADISKLPVFCFARPRFPADGGQVCDGRNNIDAAGILLVYLSFGHQRLRSHPCRVADGETGLPQVYKAKKKEGRLNSLITREFLFFLHDFPQPSDTRGGRLEERAMFMEQKQGMLLERDTNELEIVEFGIGENRFGINVLKVKEILNPQPVTQVPRAHPFVEGIIDIRGEVVPVVDVAQALGFPASDQPEKDKLILTEFNQTKIVFHVHTVTQIHRISWEHIEKPGHIYQGLHTQITGVIKREGDMLLLLDFEKVVADIHSEGGMKTDQLRELGKRERSSKKILMIEDSPMLRTMLQETLSKAGYDRTVSFENGREAWEHLSELIDDGKTVLDEYQLIITDIEMPLMDGHHLTKLLKDHQELQKLPVIIFSSLITEDLRHQGEKAGADAQVSKPEIMELVTKIDQYIL